MTSSNGKISTVLAICAGNSPVAGEFPAQRPVMQSFGVSFLCLKLSEQSWGWWFETPSRPLWRHCNVIRGNRSLLLDSPKYLYWWYIRYANWWIIRREGVWPSIPLDTDAMTFIWIIYWICPMLKNIEAETKWTPFRRRYFKMHFHEWKCFNCD